MTGPADSVQSRRYPELGAGGYSRVDGTVEFYSRVQALLPDSRVVLDLGAGRGKWQEDDCSWRRGLCELRGGQRWVVGADIDGAVVENKGLDSVVLLSPDGALPFRDGSLSLVVADWLLEHVEDPGVTARELTRVVAPGGWLCARTPNRWGYIGLGARLVPNRLHVAALRRLQPERLERDVFPTRYRLNSLGQLARAFPREQWADCSYTYSPDPGYVGRSRTALRLLDLWQRLAPGPLAATLHVFLQRRGHDADL